MSRTFILFFVTLGVCLSVSAQVAPEAHTLVSGQPVERQIAGGQSHNYRIILQAGQFMRVVVEQRAIDVALALAAPDGKQAAEVNLTRAGGLESLSAEAAVSGKYQLTIRALDPATVAGSYRVRLEVKAAATAQDGQRMAAEALVLEAHELRRQGGKTADQRIEKLQQALAVWRELGDRYWAAWSLYSIGVAYSNLSRYERAIECYEQALAIAREVKDRLGEANAITSLGINHRNLGRSEKAIEYFEQALAIYREVKNRGNEGLVLSHLGRSYFSLSRYERAIEYSEQGLAIAREVKNRDNERSALNDLGLAYRDLGRYERAAEYFEQSLAIAREVKNRGVEGIALDNLGSAYYGMGRFEKAIEYHEQALAIRREVKDRAGEAYTLDHLGYAYINLGRYEKAIEYLEQALTIAREVKYRTTEGNALNNLGHAYLNFGRYEKAIDYYEQALATWREVRNRNGEANALGNLGIFYSSLGRYERAIEYYEQALAIRREVKNRNGEASALGNLGIFYYRLGRYERAVKYFEQSLAINREVKNRANEGSVLNNLGDAYRSQSRYEEAIAYYRQALAIAREVKRRADEGAALAGLGDAYRDLGQHEKAVGSYQQALAIHREVKDRAGEATSLYSLAQAERAQGDILVARTHAEESLKIAESLRSEVISPESRASFLASIQNSYRLYTDLLMRQHRAEPTKGLDALAVEVSERQRARSLLDLLGEARADLRQGVDAALLERERSLGKQLNDKAQRLTRANKPEEAAALKHEINQLENDYERAQAAIRKASPHYAALTQPQPLKLREIQAQLDADTLLLEYSLGEERSYLWAITRDSMTSYELPKGELIKQNALQVYEMLTARSTTKRGESAQQRQERIKQAAAKLSTSARSLSDMLLAPVSAQLGSKRLAIVADGALQYIPFAMLPEPELQTREHGDRETRGKDLRVTASPLPRVGSVPLIVKHEIVSLPSASALAIQRSELAGRMPAPKLVAVIADPVFDHTDERLKSPVLRPADKESAPAIDANDARSIEHLANNSGDPSGVTTVKRVIPRLVYTRQEANQILALSSKSSSFRAIDFQATRAAVLDPALSQYRYIHFATHGLMDSERPGLSALVLSMVDAQGQPQNGFLRANDIYNLKLPAELVVLSACQTGLGKEIKGEGLVGLTRGFMYAGAARVVVSLWNVNDKATADLMRKFYEKMLKQGERPAAALRAAQVEMWKQKQWQSPYYWAAFVLQGEWK